MGVTRQIIQQETHIIIKQRQMMLTAQHFDAGINVVIKGITMRKASWQGMIVFFEKRDGVIIDNPLRAVSQRGVGHICDGLLAMNIKMTQRLQLCTEKIGSQRMVMMRGKNINDAAAQSKRPHLIDAFHRLIARMKQPQSQFIVGRRSFMRRNLKRLEHVIWRHLLNQSGQCGDEHPL